MSITSYKNKIYYICFVAKYSKFAKWSRNLVSYWIIINHLPIPIIPNEACNKAGATDAANINAVPPATTGNETERD